MPFASSAEGIRKGYRNRYSPVIRSSSGAEWCQRRAPSEGKPNDTLRAPDWPSGTSTRPMHSHAHGRATGEMWATTVTSKAALRLLTQTDSRLAMLGKGISERLSC